MRGEKKKKTQPTRRGRKASREKMVGSQGIADKKDSAMLTAKNKRGEPCTE